MVIGFGFLVASSSADHDPPDAFAHVVQAGGQCEDGHQLARHGDVESGLSYGAICFVSQTNDHVTHGSVIHVDDAVPRDRVGINVQFSQSWRSKKASLQRLSW